MGYYEVRADVSKNRLYVKQEGFLVDEQTKESVDRMLQELEKLKPGFNFIGDLSGGKASSQQATKEFNRVYQAFSAKGIGRSILIVEDEIVRMQLERKGREAAFKEEYVASVEEAERMLDAGITD